MVKYDIEELKAFTTEEKSSDVKMGLNSLFLFLLPQIPVFFSQFKYITAFISKVI